MLMYIAPSHPISLSDWLVSSTPLTLDRFSTFSCQPRFQANLSLETAGSDVSESFCWRPGTWCTLTGVWTGGENGNWNLCKKRQNLMWGLTCQISMIKGCSAISVQFSLLRHLTYLLTNDFGKLKGIPLTLSGIATATSSKSRRTIRQAASYFTWPLDWQNKAHLMREESYKPKERESRRRGQKH